MHSSSDHDNLTNTQSFPNILIHWEPWVDATAIFDFRLPKKLWNSFSMKSWLTLLASISNLLSFAIPRTRQSLQTRPHRRNPTTVRRRLSTRTRWRKGDHSREVPQHLHARLHRSKEVNIAEYLYCKWNSNQLRVINSFSVFIKT